MCQFFTWNYSIIVYFQITQARGTKLCVDGGSYIAGRPAFCKPCYNGSFTQVRSCVVHMYCKCVSVCMHDVHSCLSMCTHE